MSSVADYAGLIKLLFVLKRLPDALGETTLTPEEATKIAALGFEATPGRWRVPPLPPDLTLDNPLFESLSIGWEEPPIPPTRPSTLHGPQPKIRATGKSGETAPPKPNVEVIAHFRNEVERSAPRPTSPADEAQIRKLVAKMRDRAVTLRMPMRKRRWQQLYWRFPARIFKPALGIILGERRIFLETN